MSYPYPFKIASPESFIVDGGYCTVQDVQTLFKNIASYSQLDADEISRRIGDATVEIDRALEVQYITPISGDPNALTVLRLICSRLAAAIIHETYGIAEEPTTVVPSHWRTWAELMLKDVLDGVIQFFTAPQQSPSDRPQFPPGAGATFNPADDADANPDSAPLYQRGGRGNLTSLGDLI